MGTHSAFGITYGRKHVCVERTMDGYNLVDCIPDIIKHTLLTLKYTSRHGKIKMIDTSKLVAEYLDNIAFLMLDPERYMRTIIPRMGNGHVEYGHKNKHKDMREHAQSFFIEVHFPHKKIYHLYGLGEALLDLDAKQFKEVTEIILELYALGWRFEAAEDCQHVLQADMNE